MTAYATEFEAQEYFNNRLNTRAWDSAGGDDRGAALSMATELIDRLNFMGEKTRT
jgi:hypothetical protein